MKKLILLIIFISLPVHAEDWTAFGCCTNGNPYSSFEACWEVAKQQTGGSSNCGAVQNQTQEFPSYISINNRCIQPFRGWTGCQYYRPGGSCPSAGTVVFPPDEGFAEPTGNFNSSQDGQQFCNEPSNGGTACKFEVECVGSECSAEYTGTACHDDPEIETACGSDGLSTACANACEEHGYDSESCPENACDTDPQSLSCLNQCTFHNWSNCPGTSSSSSSSTTTSSSSSSGETSTSTSSSSSGGTSSSSSSGGTSSSSASSSGVTSSSTSSSSGGTASGGSTCGAEPVCSGDPIACAQLIQTWRARCEYAVPYEIDTSDEQFQPVDVEEIEVDEEIENEIMNQTSDYTAVCPSPITFNALDQPFTASYEFICDFAIAIHDLVILIASIVAFYVVGRFIQGGV